MAGENERLWLEIALRDMTGAGKESVVKALADIKAASAEAQKTSDGGGGFGAQLATEAKKASAAFGEIGKIASGVFAGSVVADLTKDFVEFHKTTMEQVAGLGSLADRYGITTDQLQAYQAAARTANVTDKELNGTLAVFNLAIGAAAQGNKTAIESFDRLGIKILDQNGKVRANTSLLAEVSRALLVIENPAQRAAAAHELLGDKGARLTPLLREISGDIGQLVADYRLHGQIVDRDVIDKLDRVKNAGEASEQRIRALYATIAAPIQAQGLEYLNTLMGNFQANVKAAKVDLLALLMLAANPMAAGGAVIGMFGPTALDKQRGDLQKQLAEIDANIAQSRDLAANSPSQALRDRRARRAEELARSRQDVQAQLDRLDASTGRNVGLVDEPPDLVARQGGDRNPAKPVTTGGGSGADKRDRIAEALNQLRLEAAASEAAYDQLRAGYGIPLEQLEREVALRKKIADEVAKLGKFDPNDPRVEQIKDLVRADEDREARTKSLIEASRTAVEIERRMGDGRAFLRAETTRLNEALDSGRLSYDAYSVAMREASEKAEDMRLRMLGQRGGLEGLVAGMQFAAHQWERQNTMFEIGGRLYEKVIDDMISNTGALEKDFLGTLGRMALGWGKMLLDMELRAAASNVWNSMSGNGGKTNQGIIGGLASSLFDSLFGSSAGTGAGGSANASYGGSLTYGGPRAGGGDVEAGKAYKVGEFEQEWFLPRTSGTILNGRQAASLGGGGGARQIVNIHNHTDAKVSTRESALPGGGQQVDVVVMLENALANRQARGVSSLGKVLAADYGLSSIGRRS